MKWNGTEKGRINGIVKVGDIRYTVHEIMISYAADYQEHEIKLIIL